MEHLALVKLLEVVLTDVNVLLAFTAPLACATLPKNTVPVALVVMTELVVVSKTLSETEPLVVMETLARLMVALFVSARVELPPTMV